MSKEKKKNKKHGSNSNSVNNSPPSVSELSNKRLKPDHNIQRDTSGGSSEQSLHVDRLLSSLRREAMGSDRSPSPVIRPTSQEDRRSVIINSQLDNRYSNLSTIPYITFVEINTQDSITSQQDRKYIGNLHPLSISKRLCTQFNNMKINNIKRIGRSVLSLTFDSYQQANSFVSSRSSPLPKGWISYIPNYKIFRTGIIRNVDKAFSIEDIREGISWPDASINIIQIERMKYRQKDSDKLLDYSSVKIVFESVLLPEYMYVWRMRYRVSPFIQFVGRCQNCARSVIRRHFAEVNLRVLNALWVIYLPPAAVTQLDVLIVAVITKPQILIVHQ